MALLLITHDLGVVSEMADRVAVMYAGRIVEEGPAAALLSSPRHPYTRALLESIPRLGARRRRLKVIGGNVPDPLDLPPGCRFHPRCGMAQRICRERDPALQAAGEGRRSACHFAARLAG
jgi:oligopeptide transport system ATP-binding protein